MTAQNNQPEAQKGRNRRRFLAVLLGLSPLLGGEAALRALRWQPQFPSDPFVGFDGMEPLFVPLDQDPSTRVTNPAKLGFFNEQVFPAAKAVKEYRVFCLGGSTVQGRPYAARSAFTAWLELSLAAAIPDRTPRVVNCGGISYASYRLVPLLEEVLAYEPDLIIICTGQNEFLEARSYGDLKQVSAARVRARRTLGGLRTFRWVEQLFSSPAPSPKQSLSGEVDALLDYRGGLADYHRDDEWSAAVREHYAFNIEALVNRCRKNSVPVLFLLPVSNLVDCPPFKSEHADDLSERRLAEYERHWNNSLEEARDLEDRLREMQAAVAIDPRNAAGQFRLGKLYEGLGRHQEAVGCFRRARDEDICPLRMPGAMYDLAIETLETLDVPFLDLRKVIEDEDNGRPPSNRWMVDHVHPTIRGHQKIGIKIHEKLEQLRWVTPADAGFTERQKKAYRQQMTTLDEVYFATGKAKLEGLRLWTQGRAKKIQEKATDK
jgi:tetratricopeptide (TPR) repeat protein